jgi:hypothetical protein
LIRLYLQLFVWGFIAYSSYLCLFVHSGVQHILCFVFLCFYIYMLPFMVPEWMKKMTNLWYPYILFRPTGFPAPKIMKIFGFPVFWIWKYLRNWQHIYIETKKNKTQYMLDTTMHKQTQITWISNEPSYK